ncbi:hypothetical protein BDQ12DRAFT_692419 [Crucibulum laeve]|uniref:Uncharacterized protein n=1 Tax=Crucibulum laeve TaxID=68775 RepID=A0A5C3LIL2_9AGAR|nr:hypothetical protein BDQ12DRAFT_692419 [Crucibulum laeve]
MASGSTSHGIPPPSAPPSFALPPTPTITTSSPPTSRSEMRGPPSLSGHGASSTSHPPSSSSNSQSSSSHLPSSSSGPLKPSSGSRSKRPAVPLLLEAFPVPPSHIPTTPSTGGFGSFPGTPMGSHPSTPLTAVGSAGVSASASMNNPPPSRPPSAPLPPLPRVSSKASLASLTGGSVGMGARRHRERREGAEGDRSSKYSLASSGGHGYGEGREREGGGGGRRSYTSEFRDVEGRNSVASSGGGGSAHGHSSTSRAYEGGIGSTRQSVEQVRPRVLEGRSSVERNSSASNSINPRDSIASTGSSGGGEGVGRSISNSSSGKRTRASPSPIPSTGSNSPRMGASPNSFTRDSIASSHSTTSATNGAPSSFRDSSTITSNPYPRDSTASSRSARSLSSHPPLSPSIAEEGEVSDFEFGVLAESPRRLNLSSASSSTHQQSPKPIYQSPQSIHQSPKLKNFSYPSRSRTNSHPISEDGETEGEQLTNIRIQPSPFGYPGMSDGEDDDVLAFSSSLSRSRLGKPPSTVLGGDNAPPSPLRLGGDNASTSPLRFGLGRGVTFPGAKGRLGGAGREEEKAMDSPPLHHGFRHQGRGGEEDAKGRGDHHHQANESISEIDIRDLMGAVSGDDDDDDEEFDVPTTSLVSKSIPASSSMAPIRTKPQGKDGKERERQISLADPIDPSVGLSGSGASSMRTRAQTLASSAVGGKSALPPSPGLPLPASSTSSVSPSLSHSISTSTESSNSLLTPNTSTGDSCKTPSSMSNTPAGDVLVDAQTLHRQMRAKRSRSASHKEALRARSGSESLARFPERVEGEMAPPVPTIPSSEISASNPPTPSHTAKTPSKPIRSRPPLPANDRTPSPDIDTILSTTPRSRPKRKSSAYSLSSRSRSRVTSGASSSSRVTSGTRSRVTSGDSSTGGFGSLDVGAAGVAGIGSGALMNLAEGGKRRVSDGPLRPSGSVADMRRRQSETGILRRSASSAWGHPGAGAGREEDDDLEYIQRGSWVEEEGDYGDPIRGRGRFVSDAGSVYGVDEEAYGGIEHDELDGEDEKLDEAARVRMEKELDGSESDSSIDLHTPLPHLMLKHGLLSANSKLLPQSRATTPMTVDGRPGSTLSIASNGGASIMTKSGIMKDEKDTPMRRVRHRDDKTLRGGIELTTGLGWSDSEDEDAPSPLTRRLSTLNLSRRSSASSMRSTPASHTYHGGSGRPHPLSRSYSSGLLSGDGDFDNSAFGDVTESGEWAQKQRKVPMTSLPPTSWQKRSGVSVGAGVRSSTGSAGSNGRLSIEVSGKGSTAPSRTSSASSRTGTRRVTKENSGYARSSDDTLNTPSTASTLSIPLPITPSEGTTNTQGGVIPLDKEKSLPPLPGSSLRKYPSNLSLNGSKGFPRTRTYSSMASSPPPTTAPPLPSSSIPITPATPRLLRLPQQASHSGDRPAVPVPSISSYGALRTPSLTSRYAGGMSPPSSVPPSPQPPPTPTGIAKPKPRTGTGMVYRNSSAGSKMRAPMQLSSSLSTSTSGLPSPSSRPGVPRAIAL